MQIHELNTFSGTLGSGSFVAIDDGSDTGKVSTEAILASTEARIDNLISGVTVDSEVIDARLGADGVTYGTLGTAIRTQFTDVKDDIEYTYEKNVSKTGDIDGILALNANDFEIGNISISGSGWTYASWATRVRTKAGTTIRLEEGDIVGLTSYTNARYYLGWLAEDSTYGYQGWLTHDFTVAEAGEYVILICNLSDTNQGGDKYPLLDLLFIQRGTGINGTIERFWEPNPFAPLYFSGSKVYYDGSNSPTYLGNYTGYYLDDFSVITAQSGTRAIAHKLETPITSVAVGSSLTLSVYVEFVDTKSTMINLKLSTGSTWGSTNSVATTADIVLQRSGLYTFDFTELYNAQTYYNYLVCQTDNPSNINRIAVLDAPALSSPLKGKKWIAYGDSITAQGKWQYLVYYPLGLEYENHGVGSSCVADVPNPSATGFCDNTRISAVPADADIITIMGGTNDFDQTETIGTISDLYTSFDTTTFMGAVAYIVKEMQTQAPNARIILMSNVNSRGETGVTSNTPPIDQYGHSVYDFAKAMRDVAEFMSVDFIDVYACGINTLNRTTYVDDTVHPNAAGGKLIGRKVLEYFSTMKSV